MSAEVITIAVLSANAGVTALVGARIYVEDGLPTAPLPKIQVGVVNEDEGYTLSGDSQFPQTRVTVECIAANAVAIRQIAKAVKAALNDYTGTISGFWANFQKEGTEYSDRNDDLTVFRLMIDYLIDWKVDGG